MEVSKPRLVGMTGILIGILGVVGPIGWDYYKSKSGIELRATEQTIIFEKQKKLDGLVITYAGETLDELSKTTYSIVNSGRNPILKKDMASPLYVTFTKDSKIIDAKIDSTQPPDMGASIQFIKPESRVIFDFTLLNPGDRITFSVLAKTANIDFIAGARIAGVTSLKIVKDIVKAKNSNKVPWTVYPVGFFSILLFLAALVGISKYPAERKIRKLLKAGEFVLPKTSSKGEFINWINKLFYFTTNKDRTSLITSIMLLPDTDDFSTVHQDLIMYEIQNLMAKSLSNLTGVIIVSIIVSLGGWYVISNI